MTSEDGPLMYQQEDRLILHDLRGVNIKVDFFLGSRKEFLDQDPCVSYSIKWRQVDVRVDQVTVSEHVSELGFFFSTQRLFIDNFCISGEVFNFQYKNIYNIITASCVILLGRDY